MRRLLKHGAKVVLATRSETEIASLGDVTKQESNICVFSALCLPFIRMTLHTNVDNSAMQSTISSPKYAYKSSIILIFGEYFTTAAVWSALACNKS